jgi:amino acid transporter
MFKAVAASIAELVSAYPTSGGLYSASAFLVPRAARPLTGYLIGWLNLLGQVSGVASTEFSISRFIWAAVVISKDGDYEVTNAKLWGLYAGLLVLHGAINCLPTGYLSKITTSFVFINLGTVLAVCIALGIKTENKHPPSYIFGNVFNESGWSSPGLAFLLGLLSVQWTMTDYGAFAASMRNCVLTRPRCNGSHQRRSQEGCHCRACRHLRSGRRHWHLRLLLQYRPW